MGDIREEHREAEAIAGERQDFVLFLLSAALTLPLILPMIATLFGARMAASHGLNIFLVWLAFTQQSHAAAAWVLVVRALSALAVPMVVGHLHDRGSIAPWLRAAAVVEAGAAASIA